MNGAARTILWTLVIVAVARVLPSDVSAETLITSVQTNVRTDGSRTYTETQTVVTTYTATSGSGSTSTYVPMKPPPKKKDPPIPELPKKKDGMCQGDQAMACAAAAVPAAMALLPMLKGLGDKSKDDSNCPPGGGGDSKKGGGPDAQSKCARENDTKKLKAQGKK